MPIRTPPETKVAPQHSLHPASLSLVHAIIVGVGFMISPLLVGEKEQLAQDLATAKQDRADAKAAIDSATAQREKEADAYAAESTEEKANIAATKKAIDAIATGMAGAFLQSTAATALRNIAVNANSLDRYQRGVLTDFLSASTEYAPGSGEIVGILKQLLEDSARKIGAF